MMTPYHHLTLLVFLMVGSLAGAQMPLPNSWLPPPPVVSPDNRFGLIDQSLAVTAPLLVDGVGSLTAQAGVRREILPGRPPEEEPGPWLADQYLNLSLGLSGTRTLRNGWTAGANVNFGYRGDAALLVAQTLTTDVRAFLRLPALDQDAVTLSMNYSPVTTAALPTPTVGYTWMPTRNLSADFGVPLPLTYSPDRARVSLSPPPGVTGQIRLQW